MCTKGASKLHFYEVYNSISMISCDFDPFLYIDCMKLQKKLECGTNVGPYKNFVLLPSLAGHCTISLVINYECNKGLNFRVRKAQKPKYES